MENALAYGPQIFSGFLYTALLTLCSIPCAALVGAVLATLSLSRSRGLRAVSRMYAALFRSLPELMILLFFYYGLSKAVSAILFTNVEFSSFSTAIVALSLISGAYVGEVLRGAIQAVPVGQTEAALSLGLRPITVWVKVIMPQAVRLAIPPLGSVLLILLKDTALASVIGIEELMRKSSMAAGSTHSPFLFFGAAAVIYLIASVPILLWQDRAEKRSVVTK